MTLYFIQLPDLYISFILYVYKTLKLCVTDNCIFESSWGPEEGWPGLLQAKNNLEHLLGSKAM
jgi:hypothetical protein